MGSSVYVASTEGYSGKSTVALGLLEQLSRRVERVGVFRPVVRADSAETGGRDYVLDLLTSHEAVTLTYDECAGVTYDDVHADAAVALDRIVDRYHQVADLCDAVLVVGTDYTDVGTPTEFAFNARIAANLGAPVLLVLNGNGRSPEDLHTMASMAAFEIKAQHGTLFAVVANRCDSGRLDEDVAAIAGLGVPAHALPDDDVLNAPSVADLMRACQREGLFRIERDRQGVMRLFPGNVMQYVPESDVAVPELGEDSSRSVAESVEESAAAWQASPDAAESTREAETEVVDGDVVQEVDTPSVIDVEAAPQREPAPLEQETASGSRSRSRRRRTRGEGRATRKVQEGAPAPRARKTSTRARTGRGRTQA